MSVLIVGPNLALDHLASVPHLTSPGVLRADDEMLSAGGKGANVARALRILGVPSTLRAVVAGRLGDVVAGMLNDEGIDLAPTQVAGDTRIASIIRDTSASETVVVNGPGPTVSAADWKLYMDGVLGAINALRPSVVVCTGSLPAGASPSSYGDVVVAARQAGCLTIVDATDDALECALAARPTLVKINRREAAGVLGIQGRTSVARSSVPALLDGLVASGAGSAIVTLGSGGAAGMYRGVRQTARVSGDVENVNATGAGDCFLAAFVSKWLESRDFWQSFESGVAVGTASVEVQQPGWFATASGDECLARLQRLPS